MLIRCLRIRRRTIIWITPTGQVRERAACLRQRAGYDAARAIDLQIDMIMLLSERYPHEERVIWT